MLVGLEEAHEKPEEPVRYLREMFKSQELSPIAAGRERVDVEQLLADHEELRARTDEMSASLQAKLEQIAALESGRALSLLEKLLGWFPLASEAEGEEGAAPLLDIAQLSAAVQRHCPPTPEGEEGAEAEEPAEAEAQPEAETPSGSAGLELLTQWTTACFGYESELRARVPALSLELLCESADPANAPEDKPLADPELLPALQARFGEPCVSLALSCATETLRPVSVHALAHQGAPPTLSCCLT